MVPAFLMVILSLFVFWYIFKMVKNHDDIFALMFASLYIYTIFSQIGYCYFPSISSDMGAYFGKLAYYKYYFVVFSSFIFSYYMYNRTRTKNERVRYNVINVPGNKRTHIFYLVFILLLVYCTNYFNSNRFSFQWGTERAMGSAMFSFIFGLFTTFVFCLYVRIRKKYSFILLILLIISIILIIQVYTAAGNRSSILYFVIMLAMYELYPLADSITRNKKIIIFTILGGYLLIQGLMGILALRNSGVEFGLEQIIAVRNEKSLQATSYEDILTQDYYAPSHTLFVAVGNNYVHPFEVILSNLTNVIIGLPHRPLISSSVLSNCISLKFERYEGWASYLFLEGYVFMGLFAFIYNGVVLVLFLRLLLFFSKTKDKTFKRAMIAMVAHTIIMLVRSQSSYFLQSFIFGLLPGFFILAFALNKKIIFIRHKNRYL